jgi:hypothetical protein
LEAVQLAVASADNSWGWHRMFGRLSRQRFLNRRADKQAPVECLRLSYEVLHTVQAVTAGL